MLPVEDQEVIGLENHVVEFKERQGLFPVESGLHRFECKHPIHREMAPDLAQKGNVAETVEPFGIVQHQGIIRTVAERQVARKDLPDAGDVGFDLPVGQKRALVGAERRITDPGRAAAHQDDGPVPGLLKPTEHHDLDQAADMQ